jgi:hypothetical protein
MRSLVQPRPALLCQLRQGSKKRALGLDATTRRNMAMEHCSRATRFTQVLARTYHGVIVSCGP